MFDQMIAAEAAVTMRHRQAERKAERELLKTMSPQQRIEYRIKKEKEREVREQRQHEIKIAEINAKAKEDDGTTKLLLGFLFGSTLT